MVERSDADRTLVKSGASCPELIQSRKKFRAEKRRKDELLRHKGIVLLVSVMALIIAFSAIAGAAAGKTKLVVFVGWNQLKWDDPTDNRAKDIKLFQRENPDIDLQVVQAPINDMGAMIQKVSAMLQAGEQLDVINDLNLTGASAQFWNYVEDLTPYIKKDKDVKAWKYNIKDIWDYVKMYNGDQTKIYCLPGQVGLTLAWWNKKLFAEAGLPAPPLNYEDKGLPGKRLSYSEWTTDKYAEFAQKLTKYDQGGNPVQLGCFEGGHQLGVWQLTFLGPTIVGKDYEITKTVKGQNRVTGTRYTDPGYVKLIQWMIDLQYKYKAIGEDQEIYKKGIDFPLGNVGLRILPSWFNNTCNQKVGQLGDYYDLAPAPHIAGYKLMSDSVPWGSTGWINTRSKIKDAAWRYLKWFASPKFIERAYVDGSWSGAPPFTKEMIPQGYAALLNTKTPANTDFLFTAQSRAYLKAKRKPGDWNESGWWNECGQIWDKMKRREIGIEEGLKQIDAIGKRHYDEGWAIEPQK